MPRFTVLMPTHCRPDVIGFAIQSVLDQTERDFELIVVGDGAVPGTEAAVARFSDPRLRWIGLPKAPNFGYANRNIALETSTGELVAFAADDDLLFPDHLERLGTALEDKRCQLAYSQALWVSTDGIAAPCVTNLECDDELQYFLEQGNTVAAICVAYRASAMPTRRCWPENLKAGADWHLWRQLIERHGSEAVRHVRMPTCLHFSARWKKSRHSGLQMFKEFLVIADSAPWWPEPLRITIPDGEPEQAVFARALLCGGSSWCEALRLATYDLVSRTTRDAVTELRPRLRRLEADIRTLERDRARLEHDRDSLKQDRDRFKGERDRVLKGRDDLRREADRLKASWSWRLTRPLRAVKQVLTRSSSSS